MIKMASKGLYLALFIIFLIPTVIFSILAIVVFFGIYAQFSPETIGEVFALLILGIANVLFLLIFGGLAFAFFIPTMIFLSLYIRTWYREREMKIELQW